MADATDKTAAKKVVNTEKYEGPGRFTSALGTSGVWGIPGGAVAGVFSIPLLKNLSNGEALGFATKGAKRSIFGGIVGTAIVAYGFVSGWKTSNKAKDQFNELKSQRDNLEVHNAVLKTEVGQMVSERKQHAAGMSPRAGGYADAAVADKAAAAGAEAAR